MFERQWLLNTTWFVNNYFQSRQFNKLEITRTGDVKEKMIIAFLPSSHGDRNYEHLYIGTIPFRDGTFTVKLPPSEDWSALKKIKLCPLSYMDYYFLDISEYQK